MELKYTALRLIEVYIVSIRGRFWLTHLKKIYTYIFQDLYDWASKPRIAGFLSKTGTIFCRGEYVDSYAAEIFGKIQAEKHL